MPCDESWHPENIGVAWPPVNATGRGHCRYAVYQQLHCVMLRQFWPYLFSAYPSLGLGPCHTPKLVPLKQAPSYFKRRIQNKSTLGGRNNSKTIFQHFPTTSVLDQTQAAYTKLYKHHALGGTPNCTAKIGGSERGQKTHWVKSRLEHTWPRHFKVPKNWNP